MPLEESVRAGSSCPFHVTATEPYFFDTHDGARFTRDDEGIELKDLEAAKAEAKKALPDIVKDEMSDGDRRAFVVIVKDEAVVAGK